MALTQPALPRALWWLLGLALVCWTVIFGLRWVPFWLGMGVAATTLAGLSVLVDGCPLRRTDWTIRALGMGLVSAGVLYGVFLLGNSVAGVLFDFAPQQVAAIYGIRTEGQMGTILFTLLFVTSPAEELFWRGFVQRRFMTRFGDTSGWLVGASVYAGVHVLSGNVMLTLAALVAGLFWGWIYLKTHNLPVCIVSHALWTVSVFVLWPIG